MASMDHMPKMHIYRDIACSKPNTLNRSSLALRSEASSASSPRFAQLRSQSFLVLYIICLKRLVFEICAIKLKYRKQHILHCERSRAKRGELAELASLRKARELLYRYMGKQNNRISRKLRIFDLWCIEQEVFVFTP